MPCWSDSLTLYIKCTHELNLNWWIFIQRTNLVDGLKDISYASVFFECRTAEGKNRTLDFTAKMGFQTINFSYGVKLLCHGMPSLKHLILVKTSSVSRWESPRTLANWVPVLFTPFNVLSFSIHIFCFNTWVQAHEL